MREYIKNLTDTLIGQHGFELMSHFDRQSFVGQVSLLLIAKDLWKMKPETLGEIMCSFEEIEVEPYRENISRVIHFTADCRAYLQEVVALCLAYAIWDRVDTSAGRNRFVPQYRKK